MSRNSLSVRQSLTARKAAEPQRRAAWSVNEVAQRYATIANNHLLEISFRFINQKIVSLVT